MRRLRLHSSNRMEFSIINQLSEDLAAIFTGRPRTIFPKGVERRSGKWIDEKR